MNLRFIHKLIDPLFPPRESELVLRTMTDSDLHACVAYHRHNDHIASLLPYHSAIVKACIAEAKFHQNRRALTVLGAILAPTVREQYKAYACVPIPISRTTHKKRQHNQVVSIMQAAGLPVTPLLAKPVETRPQKQLKRAERLENLQGSFTCQPRLPVTTPLLLIDDVITTGATFAVARSCLQQAGYQTVECLALAH